MINTLQVNFRNMPPSAAVETRIRKYLGKIEDFYHQIISCRVMIEAPHKHHHHGNLYHVRICISVPHGEIIVNRQPSKRQSHQDIYVAIRDAFNAAKRELDNFVRVQRHQTKNHTIPPYGRIAALFPDEGYGFIETPDGEEIYFHYNSLLNGDFQKLDIGKEVRFHPEAGDKGPQASVVKLIGKKHRLVGSRS